MRKSRFVLVVSAIVVSAPLAWAQRPQGGGFGGGAGGGLFLLAQESVQKELGLSADQVKQVDDYLAKQREAFSGLRDLDRAERREKLQEAAKSSQEKLGSLLNEEQLARYKQISLQQRGGQALADPRIGEAIGLTADQKSKIREIQTEARDEMRSLFQGGGGDRQAMREKFQKARAAVNETIMGVLDADQQAQWNEMIGKPFSGELRKRFRRGGAGGNRRRNRNADDTGAAIDALPEPAASVFRLASFRADDADDDGDDDDDQPSAKRRKGDAQGKAKAHKAKARKAKKPGMAKAKRRGPDAHRAGPPRPHRSHAARRPHDQRDRAWAHVARMMRHRGARPPEFGSRGRGRGFTASAHRHRPPHMARGGQRSFGPPRHGRPQFAGFRHGRRADWGFAHASRHGWHHRGRFDDHRGQFTHRGPSMMAHHRGHFPGHSMAARHFRGHHGFAMAAHRPHHGHGPAHHAVHGPGHHGPRAGFAPHRRGGPTRMASYRGDRPHGRAMGKHHGHHRHGGSAHARGDRDRDHSDAKSRRDREGRRQRDRDRDDDEEKGDDQD